MIREFTEGIRIFFFPIRWANSVARWIAGVHSKTGTVKISNTLSPGKEGSVSIDVDLDGVVNKVNKRLGFDRESPLTRVTARNLVFDLLDGASIINNGRRISVNTTWLAQQMSASGSSSTTISSDTPQNVASTASAGSSTAAAPSDHVHALDTDSSLAFDSNGTLGVSAVGDGNKWMKTDSDGYASTTDDKPVITPESAGVIYSNGDGKTISLKTVGSGSSYDIASGGHEHDYSDVYAGISTESVAEAAAEDAAQALSSANTAAETASEAMSKANEAASAVSGKLSKSQADGYYQAKSDVLNGISTGGDYLTTGHHLMGFGGPHYSGIQGNHSQFVYGCLKNDSAIAAISAIDPDIVVVDTTNNSNRLSSWIKSGTSHIDGSKVYFATQTSAQVAEVSTDGQLVVSSSTYSKFTSAPNGESLVKTADADGSLSEVSLGNGVSISNNELSVKVNSNGGLSLDKDGLAVKVKASSGITLDSDGLQLTKLTGTKWMKTAADGSISVTDDVPVTLPTGTGFVYSTDKTVSLNAFGTTSGTVAEGNHNHDQVYSKLEHNHDSEYADIDHDHSHAEISDWDSATNSFLTDSDIDVSVQAYSEKLDDLDDLLNENGTVPASAVSDAKCSSAGDCLAYFNSETKLAHLGTGGITVKKANAIANTFSYTAQSDGTTTAVLNYKAFGASAAPTEKKAVGFVATASDASLIDVPTVDTEASSIKDGTLMTWDADESKFVKDGNEYAALQPKAVDSSDSSYDTAAEVAAAHPTNVNACIPASETAAAKQAREIADIGTSTKAARADHKHRLEYVKVGSGEQGTITGPTSATDISGYADTWTNGTYHPTSGSDTSDVGVKISVCTGGTMSADGGELRLNFRILTFDRMGRLYSVGSETKQFDLDVNALL